MTYVLHLYTSEESTSIDSDIRFYALAHDAVLEVGMPYVLKIELSHNLLLLNIAETDIRFESSMMQVESVQLIENNNNDTLVINSVIDNHNGLIYFTCGSNEPFAEEAGLTAEVVITPLRKGSTTLYFGPNQDVQMYDCFDADMLHEDQSKTVTLLKA